jgi:glucosamine 6-phosphate synthetase-like amidotransferase/phosphosugar isomerase protein
MKWEASAPSRIQISNALRMLLSRGRDAWGLAIADNCAASDIFVFKHPSCIGSRKNKKFIYERLKKASTDGWLMLHSRLSTNGYSGHNEHNHPVEYKNITLIHNGLVVDWPSPVKNLLIDTSTDSQNLARIIHSTKESALENMLNNTTGEISIVWHNSSDNTLKLYSNVGGLYIEKQNNQTMVSSEPIKPNGMAIQAKIRKIVTL